MKPTHGGNPPPRKRGAKKLPPGQKKVGGSIALTPAQWRKLDRMRGKTPRGTYIAENLLGENAVAQTREKGKANE